jgi:hypothetical protein
MLLLDDANLDYIKYEEFLGACMDKNKLTFDLSF